jgi:hypothetical protein
MGSLSTLDAILVAKLAPLCTPAMRWDRFAFFLQRLSARWVDQSAQFRRRN